MPSRAPPPYCRAALAHKPDQCKHPLRPLRGAGVYGMLAIMSAEMNRATRVVSARLPRASYDRVVELANEAGKTRGDFVRDAVAEAIEQHDQETPDG